MSCTVAFYFIKGLPSLMGKLISSSRSVLSLWLIEVKMFGHECQKITWKQSKLLKILLSINMYLAKLNVVLSFLNKTRQTYKLNKNISNFTKLFLCGTYLQNRFLHPVLYGRFVSLQQNVEISNSDITYYIKLHISQCDNNNSQISKVVLPGENGLQL